MAMAAASLPMSFVCSTRSSYTLKGKKRRRIVCNFGHFGEVVRKDMEFLKKGFSWASEALHLPKLSNTFEDLLWLRTFEDPHASPLSPQSWPQPFYPGLTGMDLFMADLKALEAYASYVHYLSKMWSKPLPESYDPQEVEDYFGCRPHVVTLRFIEVFASFAFAAIKMRTSRIFKLNKSGVDKNGNTSEYYFGKLLKEAMLNLGPTFIKVGQSLSTRPDIIGSEISKALSELHDQIPPFPRKVAMQIIEEELGSPVETIFNYISEEPVAAASFGQVYRGSTFDGYSVAVKVQRPNLRHVVVRDIYILRLGLGILQKVAKRKSDLRLYADELGKGLVGELDYTLEAANASEFQEAHSPFPFIFVPRVFRHLTRKRLLTMEWVVGENPNDLLLVSTRSSITDGSQYSGRQELEAKKRLLDMVNKGVEASLVQLLETGILHADPHPGNLRYTATGKIGFLDFGLICRMEKRHQFAMLASIVHIVNGDWAALVNDLTEMDVVRPGTSIRRVTMDLEDSLGEVEFKDGIPDIKFSRVLGKIWSIALKYHFRMPPYYTLVLRSLASLEGLAVAADQDFKTFESAYPYVVRKLLTDNSAPSRRLLHSVVFNKKKEFQWQKLALFLRVGATRNGLQRVTASKSDTPTEYTPNGRRGVLDLANLVLRLLPSKDGAVLRRLLMTVDGASLIRAMVSKEAIFFRQQVSRALADLLYQWMIEALGQGNAMSVYNSRKEVGSASGPSTPIYDYQSCLRDRRLKVIFYKLQLWPVIGFWFHGQRCIWLLCQLLLAVFSFVAYEVYRRASGTAQNLRRERERAGRREGEAEIEREGVSYSSGFTRLCKGLAVVLVSGHVVLHIFPSFINYLALIPARTIPFAWNLITAGYIEQHIIGVILSTLGLLFIGRLLEPIWGSREFLKFIFVVNFLTSVCVFVTAIALYYITTQENYLYTPLSGFHGVLSGFLVGIKQIFPDQELSIFPALKIKAKWMPSLLLFPSIAVSFFVAESASYLPTIIFGTYMSWIYLRYLQKKPETSLRGDPSDEFAFSTFFPELLRPVINPIASIFGQLLCGRSEVSSEAKGYALGSAPLPGSDPVEASRRRERGARALEERLAAEGLSAGASTEDLSRKDAAQNV
ncbi:Protein kinase domain [Macleaya cordata]|uniref:Protein kinase domain n=1 Tax=Macleaya cordata TaxID=56857 RepID=A0A200R5V2_MACCD|nr:Protein kinase domain [Macleaya cordata]